MSVLPKRSYLVSDLVASETCFDGSSVAYGSDGGAVTSVVSVAGTTAYALDRAGRRASTMTPGGDGAACLRQQLAGDRRPRFKRECPPFLRLGRGGRPPPRREGRHEVLRRVDGRAGDGVGACGRDGRRRPLDVRRLGQRSLRGGRRPGARRVPLPFPGTRVLVGDGVDELPYALVRPRDGPLAFKGPDWIDWRNEPICVLW